MEKRWILLTDRYEGLEKKAINMLFAEMAGHLPYVLSVRSTQSVTEGELANANIILVGRADGNELIVKCQKHELINLPQRSEGYAVYVGESVFGAENQMIVIAGFDTAGVLYGCMDFCNKYLGDVIYRGKNIWTDETFDQALNKALIPWQVSTAPTIRRRAIWTWGHVIYDYRGFFENMARLRLNEIVIWNDVAPLNAKDVVDYAHSLNIKVIWGFAWGWDTSCKNVLDQYDDQFVGKVKKQVLKTYEREYRNTGADGIYFQTVTEHNVAEIQGKPVAQLVTELVNEIAGTLLERKPDLHIQFGLHATSVKNKLEYIKNVDKRIYIVWEDCGSFPFEYYADKTDDFESTLKFTENTLVLRGNDEKWGAVLKGMLKLDWRKFEHFSAPYILGERTDGYIKQRQAQKDRIWKLQQASWLKNADYVRRIIEAVGKYGKEDAVVQGLVEDAMLENRIAFPVALLAEMLWSPEGDSGEMIEQVSKYPCVQYANI